MCIFVKIPGISSVCIYYAYEYFLERKKIVLWFIYCPLGYTSQFLVQTIHDYIKLNLQLVIIIIHIYVTYYWLILCIFFILFTQCCFQFDKAVLHSFVEQSYTLSWCKNPTGCDQVLYCDNGMGSGVCAKCLWSSCFSCNFVEVQ